MSEKRPYRRHRAVLGWRWVDRFPGAYALLRGVCRLGYCNVTCRGLHAPKGST
jgi:hypothetical protein